MIGKFSAVPPTSPISPAQPLCDSIGSTEMAIAFTLRLSNSPLSDAVTPSSVVQTGVKSAGWLNSTAQLPFFQSWKLIVPAVVSAVKSGATSPSRSVIPGAPCLMRNIGQYSYGSRVESLGPHSATTDVSSTSFLALAP